MMLQFPTHCKTVKVFHPITFEETGTKMVDMFYLTERQRWVLEHLRTIVYEDDSIDPEYTESITSELIYIIHNQEYSTAQQEMINALIGAYREDLKEKMK